MNIRKLEEEIKKHQELYYSGKPEISDEEYDALWDTLENNSNSNLLETVGVESLDENFGKFKHEIHMGSQEKIRSKEELEKWIRLKSITGDLIIQEKIDGISVELIYEDGKLTMALTRGDGEVGSDITRNIINVPEIDFKDRFSIRAEVAISSSDFNKIEDLSEVSNPRNVASGIAYQKNSKDNIDKLSVICFDTNNYYLNSEESKLIWLKGNNFRIPFYKRVDSKNIEEIMKAIDEIEERKGGEFLIDGAVIKQNLVWNKTDKVRPDHQRAYKWQSEQVVTKIIGVEWSRSGNLYTPVALLEPVKISDTIVSRASLANLNEIDSLGLRIPSEVIVEKRGEIIPKVIKMYEDIENSSEITPPTVCALCNGDLTVTGTKISCENPSCVTIEEHRIYKWIETTGALGFGPSLLNYLIYDVGMTQIHQYYCDKEFMKALKGYNRKKSLQSAFADLWARKSMKLEDFVAGFDIPSIGSKIVKLIIDEGFDTLEHLRKVKYESLIEIDGIGDIRAKIFKESMDILSDAMDAVLNTGRIEILQVKPKTEVGVEDSNISGTAFCITGKLSRPRAEVVEFIESRNGKVSSSVTKNTNYLVTNTPDSGSSKNKKAKELGIEVITEEELMKMC